MTTLPAIALPQAWPRAVLLCAIRFYKRHVSPRKGYACAYRIHTGRCSCSTLGYRAVSRYGVVRGLGVLQLRLDRCHEVFAQRARRAGPRGQKGFCDCDLPCDASCVDLPSSDCCTGDGSPLDCIDCDCDWPGRRRRRSEPKNAPSVAGMTKPPHEGVSASAFRS